MPVSGSGPDCSPGAGPGPRDVVRGRAAAPSSRLSHNGTPGRPGNWMVSGLLRQLRDMGASHGGMSLRARAGVEGGRGGGGGGVVKELWSNRPKGDLVL